MIINVNSNVTDHCQLPRVIVRYYWKMISCLYINFEIACKEISIAYGNRLCFIDVNEILCWEVL